MLKQYSVFIPMVPSARVAEETTDVIEGELIEVFSSLYAVGHDLWGAVATYHEEELHRQDRLAIEKDFDRVAASLRSRGATLYRAGCAAAGAVQKMGLKRPFLACYQWIRPQAWVAGQRLHAVNAKGPDEGPSAQLGLALALLVGAGPAPPCPIVATGSVLRDRNCAALSEGQRSHDVEVLPVGELPAKLRLVLDVARKGFFRVKNRQKEPVYFFTPVTFEQNGRLEIVERLSEVHALKDLGIEVIPVRWLSEATKKMGINRARYLPGDRLCQGFVGAVVGIALLVSAWSGWQQSPIPMAFVADNVFTVEQAPFRVCSLADGTDIIIPLMEQGLVPTIPVGSMIGWEAKVGEAETLDSLTAGVFGFAGYHLAHVLVSESTRPVLLMPGVSHGGGEVRVLPGETYAWKWLLNEKPEDNSLVILAQRHTPFELDGLANDLESRFLNAGSDADKEIFDVVGAVNYLMNRAPGALWYRFRTIEGGDACTTKDAMESLPPAILDSLDDTIGRE